MAICRMLLPIVIVVLFVSAGFAADTPRPVLPADNQPAAGKTSSPALAADQQKTTPYVAEVAGTDVYVRSGPGLNYYFCTKLNLPSRVVVVEEKTGWCRIVPPAGSFSWINKSFVSVDPANRGAGTVTGDAVRVWAGSEFEVPMRSNVQQTRLNTGDKVVLLSDEKEWPDYYKIAPPTGAFLWMSSDYLKYIGSADKTAVTEAAPTPIEAVTGQAEAPKPPSVETRRIEQCRQFDKLIETELAKPLEQQNYKPIKEQLQEITGDPEAGKAKQIAQYQIERIERYELAQTIPGQLQKQQEELDKTRMQIKQEHNKALAGLIKKQAYMMAGKLERSNVYVSEGLRRYIVRGDDGAIICYAVPDSASAAAQCQQYLGQKVGLNGRIENDPQNPGSIIYVSDIVELGQQVK